MLLTPNFKKTTKLYMCRSCFVVFLSVIASNSYAAAIGGLESITEPEPEYVEQPKSESQLKSVVQLGFGANISRASISDDVGQTNKVASVQALSVYFTDWLNQDARYLSELHISQYGFNASESYVGQEVNQQGIRFSVQKNTTITKNLSPWLGGGFDLSYSSFRKRHTVDSQGFLTKEYKNEAKPGFGILLNVMQKWSINTNMDIAAKIEYSIPVIQSVSRVSIGFILFFNLNSNLHNTTLESVE